MSDHSTLQLHPRNTPATISGPTTLKKLAMMIFLMETLFLRKERDHGQPNDESRTKAMEKMQRELKKAQKENQKQQQELEAAGAREKRLEQQCNVLADQYYEQHGRHPPESEDEVDDQDNDKLFDLNLTSHLDPEYGEDSENDSGSPIMTLFPTSVRTISVRTQSPPVTSSKAPQQPQEVIQEEQLQLRQLEIIPGESGKLLRDYRGKSKKIIRRAIRTYEASVLAAYFCPDNEIQSNWAAGIWAEEMATLPEGEGEYELTDEICRMFYRRETRIRGITWDRLIPDPEARTGYMQTEIIVQGVCHLLFYAKNAYGIQSARLFSPIPRNFIATVFTLVEYYLDQWSTGSRKPRNLDEDVLATIWIKHLERVREWEEIDPSKTLGLFGNGGIRKGDYAGIGSEWSEKTVRMSKEDQKRAVEELRDLRIPESGDESEHCEEKSEVDELDSNASNCGDDASELDSCSNNGTEEQSTVHANAGFDATSGPELETDNEAQNSGNVVVAPVDNPSSFSTAGDTPGSSESTTAAVMEENVQIEGIMSVSKPKTKKRKQVVAVSESEGDAEMQKPKWKLRRG
ncbi:hypothetical protein BT96DRAFT_999168 [Gymnopus androsaceus JB14]|uniref:DUF6532 domain-containing protein n=1 Tax=Gymnopus androsaceus JB14 TaxID=1447944 RepID=A0A6A4H974_9AGAR|nr:hypothetical protein BT96DRAFT_999168 [Gymnopus androsaceus JB14]